MKGKMTQAVKSSCPSLSRSQVGVIVNEELKILKMCGQLMHYVLGVRRGEIIVYFQRGRDLPEPGDLPEGECRPERPCPAKGASQFVYLTIEEARQQAAVIN